jgi:hypothetical protein
MDKNENEELLNKLTNVACKMVIAELELFREEINKFIDELVQKQIDEMK